MAELTELKEKGVHVLQHIETRWTSMLKTLEHLPPNSFPGQIESIKTFEIIVKYVKKYEGDDSTIGRNDSTSTSMILELQ